MVHALLFIGLCYLLAVDGPWKHQLLMYSRFQHRQLNAVLVILVFLMLIAALVDGLGS